MSCNNYSSGCVPPVPYNRIAQAINDALACRIDELNGYATSAAQSALEAAASAVSAGQSRDQAKAYRDQAQQVANTATALVPELTEISVRVQETAELLDGIANTASSYTIRNWFYTAVGGESTIVVPSNIAVATVQAVYIEGVRQDSGYGFVYDTVTRTITLAESIPEDAVGTVLTIQLGQNNADSPETALSILATGSGAGLVGTASGNTVQTEIDQLKIADQDQTEDTQLVASDLANLRSSLGIVIHSFNTVADVKNSLTLVNGIYVRTLGYYSAGDGGGADYLVTTGAPLQDYSDAGSFAINSNLFAKLLPKPVFDLKQFGVKPSDSSVAVADANDIAVAQGITRSRFGFCKVQLSDVVTIRKPLVFEYYHHLEGSVIGSDASFTPRFKKLDNTTSGIAALAYPGLTDTVPYDVDAGIILKRQNASTDFCRGVVLKNFTIESMNKSAWAIYAPHAADFDIDIDSRGFNGGIRGNVNFLHKYAGRHIGLGANAVDQTTAIGLWYSHFSSVLDCGNSGTFRLSFNNFNRGMQTEYFGNGVLERCTFENIKKQTTGAPTSFAFFSTDSSFSGQLSCESSTTCIVRAGSNSNLDFNLNAVFHVNHDDTAEGIIHVLSGGRLTLRPSNIMADTANTLIINESGGFLDIAANTRLVNTKITNADTYRFKNRTISAGVTGGLTGTSFASGAEVTFSSLAGLVNAALSGGTIQFNSPGLMKITLQGRAITAGSVTFGLNGAASETCANGQTQFFIAMVAAGDILNIKAVGTLTASSVGGIRVLLEPLL